MVEACFSPNSTQKFLGAAFSASVLAATLASGADAGPRDAIAAGDMNAVIGEIIDLYGEHGLSWAHWNAWKIGSHTTTYWYYAPFEDEIIVGDMPEPEEVGEYWSTWSTVLTDGNWDPDGFFASPTEALELARFNQWLLATHESAHAITYRYDFDHTARYDYDVNCREYHADRLTAAILQDEAAQDPDMARWRARYLDLVKEMGASIPEEYTVTQADYPALEADCRVIDVRQPTPDKMQAYASAFFTRHTALLSAELPPLDDVFDTHLKAWAQKRLSLYEIAPEWAESRVTTVARIPKAADEVLNSADILTGSSAKRAAGFAPDGTVHVAEAAYDPDTGTMTVIFGPVPGELNAVVTSMAWPRQSPRIQLRSIAVFGPDQFVATFEERENRTSAVRFRREGGEWVAKFLADETIAGTSRAYRLGDDRLLIGYSEVAFTDSENRDGTWQVLETDLETGSKLENTEVPIESRHPLGIDAEGRLFFASIGMLVRGEEEPVLTRIFGAALKGDRDGDQATGEINGIVLVQTEPDGSLLILDDVPGDNDHQLIRRIEPLR